MKDVRNAACCTLYPIAAYVNAWHFSWLPAKNSGYRVMVRREKIPFVCAVDLGIEYLEMVGDENPVDRRDLFLSSEGVKGGFILRISVELPKGISKTSSAGQEAVGVGILVGIEIAGNDERGTLVFLAEPFPQATGITINRCWFIVKVRIDVGHHSPLGMTSEPGPANCSRIGAAPAHTPGNLRSITQPEISRIKKPKGSLAKQQGRHLQCRFARTFPMDANKMVVRKVRADEARLSIIAALLETEQVRLKGMDPVEGQSPSVVPMIYPIVGKAVTNVKTHDFDHIRDVVGHAI